MIRWLILIVISSVAVFGFYCGDGNCDNVVSWRGYEDVSVCYEDCKDKVLAICSVSRDNFSQCIIDGTNYSVRVNEFSTVQCGPTQQVEIELFLKNKKIASAVTGTKSWGGLYGDLKVAFVEVECEDMLSNYTLYFQYGSKNVPGLRLIVDGIEESENGLVVNYLLETGLKAAKCHFHILSRNQSLLWQSSEAKECQAKGKLTASVNAKDARELTVTLLDRKRRSLGKARALLELSGCIECEDNNPCTNDLCSGVPLKCYHLPAGCRVDGRCIDAGDTFKGKYCSEGYVLRDKKAEGVGCSEDYECKLQRCYKGICKATLYSRIVNFFQSIFE